MATEPHNLDALVMKDEPLGYITGIKSATVMGLRACTLGEFSGIHIGIEYPLLVGEYPYVMVEFTQDDGGTTENVGIGHIEYRDEEGSTIAVKRWRFDGEMAFSIYALRAKECDEIIDKLIKTIGFTDQFRDYMRGNEYIAVEVNTEQIEAGIHSASPGTPWGTDDMVYYHKISVNASGEFTSDVSTASILRRVDTYPRTEDEPDLPDSTDGVWQ